MNNSTAFGQNGTLLKAAGTITGTYSVINALTDAVVTVVVNWTGSDPTETLTLSAGQSVYGVFDSVLWVSGAVVAYE